MDIGQQRRHCGAAITSEFTTGQVGRLDTRSAFIDRADARVAHGLRSSCIFNEAHAAVDLDTRRGHFEPNFGTAALDDRDHQIHARLCRALHLRIIMGRCAIELRSAVQGHVATRFYLRAHA